MAQYINKDDLVAEIDRQKIGYNVDGKHSVEYDITRKIIDIIKNLEVKEVDLENSVKGRIDYPLIGSDFPNIYPNYKELKDYCDKNGIKDEDKVKIIIIKDVIL